MRELSALQIYSLEEFERCKLVVVKTAERCVEEEEKIREYENVISDLRANKLEYKNDRMVDRIVNRLESCINFIKKTSGAFSSVADNMVRRREELESRRKENTKVLEKNQEDRMTAIAKGTAKTAVVAEPVKEKKKPGRPKKK